jgi:hypothetical protein
MTNKTIALCLCLLGLAAPAALAQNATTSGYGEATGVLPDQTGGTAPAGSSGTAPAVAANPGVTATPGVTGGGPSVKRSSPATAGAAPAVAVAGNGDRLPFTGVDIALFLLVGVILVGVGFGLRRLTSRPPAA